MLFTQVLMNEQLEDLKESDNAMKKDIANPARREEKRGFLGKRREDIYCSSSS